MPTEEQIRAAHILLNSRSDISPEPRIILFNYKMACLAGFEGTLEEFDELFPDKLDMGD